MLPECLIIVVVCWADAGHHQRLGVPPERGLEESGQLGVSVGNVCGAAVHQGWEGGREGGRERMCQVVSK